MPQLFALFLLGLFLGAGVVKFADTFGWEVRRRSILRPGAIAVVLLCSVALPVLYVWEVVMQMVSHDAMGICQVPFAPFGGCHPVFPRFVVHAVLFTLLLTATLIDFEDMIIPDVLTVVGTFLGLAFAYFLPLTLLPASEYNTTHEGFSLVPSLLFWFSPANLEHWRPGVVSTAMTALAVLLWYGWCFGMLHRVWYPRLGLKRAALLFGRRLYRSPMTKWYAALAVLGTVLIPLALRSDSPQSHALLSSLIGMAACGGMIWAVRIAAGLAMGREAMGFGDVTFMAMIGAFLGWQVCPLIFFLAPFAGLVVGLIGLLCGRGTAIPYGPYLALATVVVVLFWPSIWMYVEPFYSLPYLVPGFMVLCVALLWAILTVWQTIKRRVYRDR